MPALNKKTMNLAINPLVVGCGCVHCPCRVHTAACINCPSLTHTLTLFLSLSLSFSHTLYTLNTLVVLFGLVYLPHVFSMQVLWKDFQDCTDQTRPLT